ncbi:MAG: hypothetical protein AAGN64_17880, partial [Bacteroidota bacterium]
VVSTSKKKRRSAILIDRFQRRTLRMLIETGAARLSSMQRDVVCTWGHLDDPKDAVLLYPSDPLLIRSSAELLIRAVEQHWLERPEDPGHSWWCQRIIYALEGVCGLCERASRQRIPVYLFTVP